MLSESTELVLILSQMNTQTALYTFPGRGFLICLRSLGNQMNGLRASCTALSALGPKAPEEEGWHQKELEVTGSSVLCDDPEGWDGGSRGRG